jgi:hypothetical protein
MSTSYLSANRKRLQPAMGRTYYSLPNRLMLGVHEPAMCVAEIRTADSYDGNGAVDGVNLRRLQACACGLVFTARQYSNSQ